MTVQQPAGMANRPVVTIKLASTSDELMQCYALRAAVFMGEQHCPYWEEFDGNDYTACHLMLYVDGEPAGVDASALVPASPSSSAASSCSATARAACSSRSSTGPRSSPHEGLSQGLSALPAAALADLGEGRLPPRRRQVFHFSDHEYCAFCLRARGRRRAALTVHTEPMVMNRPEDRLDSAGVLEKSMERGASNPHADWTESARN